MNDQLDVRIFPLDWVEKGVFLLAIVVYIYLIDTDRDLSERYSEERVFRALPILD